MALEIAHRLVDELDLVGIRFCGWSPFRGGQMLAVDALESQAPGADIAANSSLLASFVGFRMGGNKEFQLPTDEAHG